jgi:hemerythrin
MPAPSISDIPQLPLAFMNADHAEEIRMIAEVEAALEAHGRGAATLEAVVERLALLAVHTREHFLREETAMRETRFPAYPVHKGEHDRVLAEMDAEARLYRERGDAARLARYLFEAVPAWFVHHIRTMDAMTARFVSERQREQPGAPRQ